MKYARTHSICGMASGYLVPLFMMLAGVAARAQDPGWPREMDTPKARLVIYQPQLETFKGDKLSARAAVSVTLKGREDEEPVFGAVWFDSRVATDRDTRQVRVLETKVPRVKFPGATAEQEQKLIGLLTQEIPRRDLTLSLDRVLAALELAEKEDAAAANLQTAPPKIIFSTTPAALILIDGAPELRPARDPALLQVVNTPALIAFDPAAKAYYLCGGTRWFTAPDLAQGPWKALEQLPASVAALFKAAETTATGAASQPPASTRIIVATEPAELIVTDGPPEYTPLVGSDLFYASNTGSDLFMAAGAARNYYVLLSGRWYAAPGLDGPWTYTPADRLPASFSKIPPDSPKAGVLAHVAATRQAADAMREAQVPQTAAIRRDDTSLQVSYDGAPQFEPIDGTPMTYAVNTGSAVIQADQNYYCCDDAVWYSSSAPTGPWAVCAAVPPVIYTIPPSCPLYPVRFVRIFDVTPNVVYMGYTPGYVGCYAFGGAVVYGTGFAYRGWHGAFYCPRPCTWGFHARYNPTTGSWGFAAGYATPFFAAGVRAGHIEGPAGGSVSWKSAGWWGPGGFHGYRDIDVDPGNRVYAGERGAGLGRYQHNIYNRQANVARNVNLANTQNLQQTRAASHVANNVFADRDGNIYRRTSDGWQERRGDNWTAARAAAGERGATDLGAVRTATRPGGTEPVEALSRPGGTRLSLPAEPRPIAAQGSRPPAMARTNQNLNREYQARQWGTARTRNYQSYRNNVSRSAPAPRSGGGRRR